MSAPKALIGLLAVMGSIAICVAASAQTTITSPVPSAGSLSTRTPIIYVGDFTAIVPAANPSFGLLRRMRAERDAKKINENAKSLADAVVTALHNKGWVAYHLNTSQPLPSSGWLVDGSYQQTISHSPLPTISSLSQPSPPNTHVSIRIMDLRAAHAGTLAAFTNAATLKGQGSALATNPYMIAAGVIAHRIEANSSMDTLAGAIADRILSIDKQRGAAKTTPTLS